MGALAAVQVIAIVHVLHGARWLFDVNARWMGLNIALALVPAALAVLLFRRSWHRNVLWWLGIAVFVAFLPNAPYVLTDVIHLRPSLAAAPSRAAVVLGVLPLFAALFALGTVSYVLCLRRLRRYLVDAGYARAAPVALAAVHVMTCVGIVVGRQDRLNSWDLLHPGRVASAALAIISHPAPLAVILVGVAVAAAAVDLATTGCFRLVNHFRFA